MRLLLRALAIFALLLPVSNAAAGAATTRSFARETAPRRTTLLEYVRARAVTVGSFEKAKARVASIPRAVILPEAAAFSVNHNSDAYLLYVSTVTPEGAGSVNIYPGWVHSSNPPLVGKISGLDTPSSLAIDRFGTLYICQTDVNAPVLVFPFGAREPARKLETEGTLPVAVTVAPDGTVYVSTAQYGNLGARILTYPPGATKPAIHVAGLAGDAVASLRSDERGNVFFAADFIDSPGYVGELAPRAIHHIVNFGNDSQVSSIELDALGNVLALGGAGALTVYNHASGAALETLSVPEFQSLSFSQTFHAFYAASGTITKYAYPSGNRLGTIASLAADNTFGIATFPRAPYALGH